MTTAMTMFNSPDLPAHIAEGFAGNENVLPRDTTPALTFRGKTWRLRQGGDEVVLTRLNSEGEKEPAPMVKVVILNMNQKRSRGFYKDAFQEGKNQSPYCWSSDGDRPDSDVPLAQKCAATCASCPNAVKGSKITEGNKEVTACAPFKRLAVKPASMLSMDALLLKVPQTSLWDKNNTEAEAQGWYAFDQYVDFLRQRNVKHTAAVVTKIKFDMNVAYPKLLFSPDRWLEAPEVLQIRDMLNGDEVMKLLNGKINEGGAAEVPPDTAPPATPVAPAPPAQTVQAPIAPVAPAPPAAAPTPPAAPPVTARPAPAAATDEGDAFASVGTAPAATAKPATAPRAAVPPKPAATPAPAAPVPPKPAVVPPEANAALADLAAAWDK